MDPPALWDRMQLDAPTKELFNTAMNPPLLERLEMNDNLEPLLLQRLDMNEVLGTSHQGITPLNLTTKTLTKMSWMGTNNGIQKTNVLNTWTTLSKASGEMKSQNSRLSHKSFQSSTSTLPEPRRPRMQPSNIIQEHSMRLKPSLLQQLGEENMLLSDCEPILTTFNEPQRSELMLSMNSSLRLVGNQTNPSETYHQDEPIRTMTLMNLPTKNAESSNQRCPGLTMKKRPDELVTKTVRNPAGSLDSSLAITRSSDSGSKTQEQHHSVFPPLNGTTSSRDKPLIRSVGIHS